MLLLRMYRRCKRRKRGEATNRLVSDVATFFPKGFLVQMDEPPMPRHKVTSVMDSQCLVDVYGNEVVKLCEAFQ